MDNKSIEKLVKNIYQRFLNGASIYVHEVRPGKRPNRIDIGRMNIRAVSDVDGTPYVFLHNSLQYEALITAVLIETEVYQHYAQALAFSIASEERLNVLDMVLGHTTSDQILWMVPSGSLRLGRGGQFPTFDDSPYLVPEEVTQVEAAIEKIIGDPCYDDEYTLCSKCHKLIHLIPSSYCEGADFIDIERYSDRGTFHDYYHADCVTEKKALDAYAYRYTNYKTFAQREKLVGLPEQFGHDLVELTQTFETGLHGGETADPWKILRALNAANISAWLRIYPSQFSVSFNVLVRPRFAQRAEEILATTNTSLDYDPADSMKAALQGRARTIEHQSSYPGEHNILYQVVRAEAEPVVDVFHLTADEVIERGFPRH